MDRLVIIALIGSIGTATACGSGNRSDGVGRSTPVCKGLPTVDCSISAESLPFVIAAAPGTDGVSTASARTPTAGTVCLSGTLADAGPTYVNWGAFLLLDLAQWNQELTQVSPFNAERLGITQLQFALESPPTTGIAPAIMEVSKLECPNAPANCLTAAPFYLQSGAITTTRTITAPLTTAKQPAWGDPNLVFDPTKLAGLQFDVRSLQGASLEYDFCVHDLKFLDVDGREVLPTR